MPEIRYSQGPYRNTVMIQFGEDYSEEDRCKMVDLLLDRSVIVRERSMVTYGVSRETVTTPDGKHLILSTAMDGDKLILLTSIKAITVCTHDFGKRMCE